MVEQNSNKHSGMSSSGVETKRKEKSKTANVSQSTFDMKELEILKFKTIAFVKTYENEFRKMRQRMKELERENKLLKLQAQGFDSKRESVTEAVRSGSIQEKACAAAVSK